MWQYFTGLALTVFFGLLLVVRQSVELWQRWSRKQGDRAQPRDLEEVHRMAWCSESRSEEKKVSFRGCALTMPGGHHLEPFADVFVKLECSRQCSERDLAYMRSCLLELPLRNVCESLCSASDCRTARCTRVLLALDQVDLGINTKCTHSPTRRSCSRSSSPLVIYRMTVEVHPRSWVQSCYRLLLQPHVTPEVFGVQQTSNFGVQVPIGSPRQASISYQASNSISRAAPEFGWAPASRVDGSNSVAWSWELCRCADGSKLEINRFRRSPLPQFGIDPSYFQMHPESFVANASWELPPNEWDMEVTLYTAFQQKTIGYSVKEGPTFRVKELLTFTKEYS